MVDKTNRRLNRRQILQMSSAGMAAMASAGAAGTVSAQNQGNGSEHRAEKAEQNEPKFTGNGRKVGFSKGGFGRPITEGTIDTLYGEIISNNLDNDTMALPRPTRDEDGPGSVHNVFGIVVSVSDGVLNISVDRKPVGVNPMSEQNRRAIEAQTHRKVDGKVQAALNRNNENGGK